MVIVFYMSCKVVLVAVPGVSDGFYWIDLDGQGGSLFVQFFCDMMVGGWMLVGNYYDSVGDDMFNAVSYVLSGWQQTVFGQWDAEATSVDRVVGGVIGSVVVFLVFVQVFGVLVGQSYLKICFVNQVGVEVSCRSSDDGSLVLVSYVAGNSQFSSYEGDVLVYFFV